MAVKENFDDFDGQEEVAVASKPQVKQFKKWDVFIWFINSINDKQLDTPVKDAYDNDSYGSKVFNLIAISDKCVDHKSDDGSSAGQPEVNEIIVGDEYSFFTNYKKYNSGTVWPDGNAMKLNTLPLGAIVQIKYVDKKKAEGSKYFYKNISIIGKKGADGEYMIHPDYVAPDDFSGQGEISPEDVPF